MLPCPLRLLIRVFLHHWRCIRNYLFPLKRFLRKRTKETVRIFYHSQPKPQWVKHEVMKLKAIMPQAGCRTVADTFNRMFLNKYMSVGKSFVHGVFQRYDYQIQVLRKKIKNARPRPIQPSCPWQNGRIERFFGTLKKRLNQIEVYSAEGLNHALMQFRFWYNHADSSTSWRENTCRDMVWQGGLSPYAFGLRFGMGC